VTPADFHPALAAVSRIESPRSIAGLARLVRALPVVRAAACGPA